MSNKFTRDFVYTHYNLASCMGYTKPLRMSYNTYMQGIMSHEVHKQHKYCQFVSSMKQRISDQRLIYYINLSLMGLYIQISTKVNIICTKKTFIQSCCACLSCTVHSA